MICANCEAATGFRLGAVPLCVLCLLAMRAALARRLT